MYTTRRALVVAFAAIALFAVACTPDPGGGTTTTTTIDPGPPVAVAGGAPTIGDAPLTVSFNSSGSTPGTGTDLTYSWDFGDGSAPESGPTAVHTYTTVGTYQARLTMTNSAGTSVSPPVTVTVNQDPNPKFYVRAGGGTGADCGPKANPCASIAEAQTNALANGIRTLRVAGGTYAGPLAVASGITVDGGWAQDFADYGANDVTVITGTGTAPAITFDRVSNAKVTGVNAQGVNRTSGDAVGILVSGGSSGITIGDASGIQTVVSGGVGPNATGILVRGGSLANVVNTKVNSGTPTNASGSAYGIRAVGSSVVNVTLSDITAQPGVAGVSGPAGAPGQAASGAGGGRGGDACGPSCPGGGAGGGGGTGQPGGRGGTGGNYDGAPEGGSGGSGPAPGAGGSPGFSGLFGCFFGGSCPPPGGGGAGGVGGAGAAGQSGSNTLTGQGDLFVPTNGTPGGNGGAGSGGGGGGGGGSASASGGGGGGGGAGGNGGAGGSVAGTSGGGSFGIFAANATVDVASSIVTSSAGGAGGNGQPGGRGGNGGNGGGGGRPSCCRASGGGGGGGGGAGGGGGGAGGGAGGPSIAAYHVGTGTFTQSANQYVRPVVPAAAGQGGAGSAPANSGFGGPRGECGDAGTGPCLGSDGFSAGAGVGGPAGRSGPAGPLFRVWDNGTVTN
jgi:PKD repeat protein